MAVLAMVGFEGQSIGADGGATLTLVGTAAYSTAQARTGGASLRCNPASGASGNLALTSGGVDNYAHFGLYVATLPSIDRRVFGNVGVGFIHVRLTNAGALAVYSNTTLIGTSATTPFATPGWHWVGVRQATGTGVVFLQIDGTDAVTGTATVSSYANQWGPAGTEATAVDVYLDDLVSDSAGFLAPSKVDTLLPIGDATVTGVTDNNGVASNIFDCLNNTPPIGVASANEAANPKAGMHFPASVTCTYVANLETYATVGVAATDTVLAVRSIVRHGEDIATGTKNGTLGAVSNPTIADSIAFVFGGDQGAHGAETGLWDTTLGTLTTLPSVTVGASPTITLSRASQSRVGCADFLGLVVAWTPATAAYVPRHPGINHQNPGIL